MRILWGLIGLAMIWTTGTARAEPLTFCFSTWAPFAEIKDGKPAGLSIELVGEAAKRAGFEPTFSELPWTRCLSDVQLGRYDAAMDGSPERAGYLHGAHSVTPVAIVFWVRDGSPHQSFTGYDQFKGQWIGATLGYNYVEAAMKALSQQLMIAPDDPSEVAMLAAGRTDAMLGDPVVIGDLVRRVKSPIRMLKPAVAQTFYYPLFNTAERDKLARFDAALGAVLKDGTADRLFAQRIGISYTDIVAAAAPTSN
jgi:polar amino acid transport system substrate-binding protein